MIQKWRSARVSVRLGILTVAIMFIITAVAAYFLFAGSDWLEDITRAQTEKNPASVADVPTPTPLSEPEKIAQVWAENEIHGVAGDELVKFIVSESNTRQPDMLGRFVKDRLNLATTWSYGPVVNVGGDRYEVTAIAETRLHDIVPTVVLSGTEGNSGAGGADRRRANIGKKQIFTMPFHLTVDIRSMSVSEWRAQADQATHKSFEDSNAPMPTVITIEEMFGAATAQCIHSALGEEVMESVLEILYIPPDARDDTETTRLKDAISEAGLTDVCREWMGKSPEK